MKGGHAPKNGNSADGETEKQLIGEVEILIRVLHHNRKMIILVGESKFPGGLKFFGLSKLLKLRWVFDTCLKFNGKLKWSLIEKLYLYHSFKKQIAKISVKFRNIFLTWPNFFGRVILLLSLRECCRQR